jgi:DNA-binding SARP family transcriptional activator/molybdopterin-guanine dinucleotide biosynthesis protein
MDIAVLGPLRVNGNAQGLSHRDRVVLAVLTAEYGRAVARDTLADALWGDSPPDSATKIVQGCIVRLRKLLGQDAIATTPAGYALRARADSVDSQQFARLVSQARQRLAAGEPDRTAYLAEESLALWRGAPLPDLEDWPPGSVERERLAELRLDAEDLQTEAALRLGRHSQIVGEAMARAEAAPLREHRWALAAIALYRAGRQGDALLIVGRAKAMLVSDLGLDPGRELAALELAILNQDPSLDEVMAAREASVVCPYPGLLSFNIEDEGTYFGRQGDISACLDRLDKAGVLAVVGPSGSGKSSLVRAGVAAALRRDGRTVEVVTPGSRPLDSIAGRDSGSGRTVLIVDQAEEGLAEEVDPNLRTRWVDAIVAQAQRGELVIALRSDRVGALAAHPALARLVERGSARLRQRGNASGAVEQLRPELAFELTDLRADARLADVLALGCPREAARFGEGDEVFELAKFHNA